MIIILTMIFLIIDIISKVIIDKLLVVNESVTVIQKFFNITYVKNTGAAWSMFSNKTLFLIIISIIIISFIIVYILKNKPHNKWEIIGYSLVLGGSFGNLLDRILYGYVIDFLDFNIFGYDYPIFNLADSFILVGIIILIIYTWGCKDGN